MYPDLYFLIPGDLATLTGGYAYDRALMSALRAQGVRVHHVAVSRQYPWPDEHAQAEAAQQVAAIPDNAPVLADGLAYGVMDTIASHEHQRLNIIALCHHPLAFESGLTTQQQRTLFKSEKTALDLATAVLVTSTATATLLNQAFDIPAHKITVALPGTQKQVLPPLSQPVSGQDTATQSKPARLLTVATLIQRKAHDVLIDALSRLTYLQWTARFVGGDHFDPAWAAMLKKNTETLGLGERISFVGSVADLQAEYRQADVFVLPSRFEGYGMVFAEALSFGVPVIAARAGAVPDVVPDTAGVLVAPDDATQLAYALHRILTEPEHYDQLRRGARQAAADLPDWQQSAATVLQLMRAVSARRPGS